VGDLGPGEERRPSDETYKLDADDALRQVLEEGRPYVASVDDPEAHPIERELLRGLGKQHCVAVPIQFAGGPWGELWATRTAGRPPFDERDMRFLQTVCGQIATAFGRAELFSRMSDLAFQDPLTGVANRRALDERLELSVAEALEAGDDLTVLLCDVDELKELNDVHGHEAGDAALVAVAEALRAVAGDGLVARIGGDEFLRAARAHVDDRRGRRGGRGSRPPGRPRRAAPGRVVRRRLARPGDRARRRAAARR
jgi:GGDEF domain-containing protein